MNTDWPRVRGFNWMPSWAPMLYEAWTHFDAAQAARELSAARPYCANTIRVWWDWQAWRLKPQQALAAFGTCLDLAAAQGLRVMPTLFNRWIDGLYPAGGLQLDWFAPPQANWTIFHEYVDAVIARWRTDERVVAWDLCNEPLQWTLPSEDLHAREIEFLADMCARARAAEPQQPLTIGTMTGRNVELFEPYVDVLSFHPYANTPEEMAQSCDTNLAFARRVGKPLVATETCRGSMDDEKHVEMAIWSIEALEERGIGWLLWQLAAGQMVAARPDWRHGNAPPGDNAYMAFALPDGSLRPGHQRLAAWLQSRYGD